MIVLERTETVAHVTTVPDKVTSWLTELSNSSDNEQHAHPFDSSMIPAGLPVDESSENAVCPAISLLSMLTSATSFTMTAERINKLLMSQHHSYTYVFNRLCPSK